MADVDSEFDLDMTGVGPVLPATRKAPAAEAGAVRGVQRLGRAGIRRFCPRGGHQNSLFRG